MIKSASQSSLTNDVKYRNMGMANVPSSEYLISTTILSQNEPSITFDLSGLSGTYRHLRLVMSVRTTRSDANNDQIGMQFNTDTGNNYRRHELVGDGSLVSALAGNAEDAIRLREIESAQSIAGVFNALDIEILDAFSPNKNTTVRVLSGTAGRSRIMIASGAWFSTPALTQIKLQPIASFAQHSRFSLYGVN